MMMMRVWMCVCVPPYIWTWLCQCLFSTLEKRCAKSWNEKAGAWATKSNSCSIAQTNSLVIMKQQQQQRRFLPTRSHGRKYYRRGAGGWCLDCAAEKCIIRAYMQYTLQNIMICLPFYTPLPIWLQSSHCSAAQMLSCLRPVAAIKVFGVGLCL